MRYERVARVVAETPWMIRPSVLATIVEVLTMRMNGDRLSPEEIAARIGAGPSSRPTQQVGAVAIVPIYGVLIPRANAFSQMSGGTSVTDLQGMFRAALNNDRVGSILLDIDSPGGAVAMIPEMAAEIREARGQKPIVAIANTMAASAAYYLGSQADEFVVSPSGQVGSIGVIAAHENEAGMWEQMGIETTLITAGKYKGEGNPFGPLDAEARDYMQSRIDAFYEMFLGDVAKGRGITADAVRSGYGEGRMLLAGEARKAGMVDRVETFDQALTRMASGDVRSRRVKAETSPLDIQAAQEQIAALSKETAADLADRLAGVRDDVDLEDDELAGESLEDVLGALNESGEEVLAELQAEDVRRNAAARDRDLHLAERR